jgi:hypothetical protein
MNCIPFFRCSIKKSRLFIDTPNAAAIAGCAIPIWYNSTIWMRWCYAAGSFHRSAVLTLLHLTIRFPRIHIAQRI